MMMITLVMITVMIIANDSDKITFKNNNQNMNNNGNNNGDRIIRAITREHHSNEKTTNDSINTITMQ